MNFALQIAFENAVLVALAAPLAWAVSRLARRPALTHAVWLVLLIKLITPPLYRPALPLPQPAGHANVIETAPLPEITVIPDAALKSSDDAGVSDLNPAPSTPSQVFAPRPAASQPWFSARFVIPTLQVIWLAGSAICLVVALARIVRFTHGLRHARQAPYELQSHAARLARRLGLRSAPAVYFIPAPLCPMLWAIGTRPRLLIPVALWGRLDPRERDSILLHELAHWKRRDHWVRWIELAATTIYWWSPVCWWARRELREAEEQCCDAWVLHATGDFRPYANALLRAVEFISVQVSLSPQSEPLPALASGMGQFNHLKRRIVMLKTASVARALSPRTLLAALGFSAVLLPFSPSLTGAADTPSALPGSTAPVGLTPPPVVSGDAPPTAPVALPENPGQDPYRTVALTLVAPSADTLFDDQLAAARKEIQELRQRLAQAEARLSVYKARQQGNAPSERAPGAPPYSTSAAKIYRDQTRLDDARRTETAGRADPLSNVPDIRDGRLPTAITDPSRQIDRLDKLEAQLRDLLQEIHSIRQQSTPPATPETFQRK
jgi:beta-lactamase regulating signal transducer with metallopeptidase domain